MTALEKLIKLGLTDASPLYRETAERAKVEWDKLSAWIKAVAATDGKMIYPPTLRRSPDGCPVCNGAGWKLLFPSCEAELCPACQESPCTPTDNVAN